MNKFNAGDWVYNENYGAGKIVVAIENKYAVKFNGEWRSHQMQEARLTKIEHDLRPGHRVQFLSRGTYYHGTVTSISPEYVSIEREGLVGKYERHHTTVTKLADTLPKPDLPLPPNLDTLKNTKTVIGNYTLTNVDPDVVRIMYGVDLAAPKPTKRIQEAREALDKQIKDAEAELAKLRAARKAL